ncbi:hypothetical protein FACS189490_13730 [Clostridia bacterium]|nr:hypothetical protein FACS189490_13730 [Clostridia bacterium]
MKIATWNAERLKHKARVDEIKQVCEPLNADILVFTETDNHINPNF